MTKRLRLRLASSFVLLCLCVPFPSCDDDSDRVVVVQDLFVDTLGDPAPYATNEERQAFQRGREIGLRRFTQAEGFGPEFNVSFCLACHEKPIFGGAAGRYRNFNLVGRQVPAGPYIPTGKNGIQPQFTLESSSRVPTESQTNVIATRNPLPFWGSGLLAEIAPTEILSREDVNDADGDGISGEANFDDGVLSRFGRKAQSASVEAFVRGPLFNHLGITSNPLPASRRLDLPVPSVVRREREGFLDQLIGTAYGQAAAPNSPTTDFDSALDPELSEQELFDLVSFVLVLGAPRPDSLDGDGQAGRALFEQVGCVSCHVPALEGPRGPVPAYTDLLIHDMGPDLADGVVMGEASGAEFRTQPLWGVAAAAPYLHDGRADTLDEAIRAHGGEAQTARDAYVALSSNEQAQVVTFLESLGGQDQRSEGLVPPNEPVPAVGVFGGPNTALSPADEARYLRGRAVFDRDVAQSAGMGTVFNGDSCRACHFDPVIGGSGPAGVNVMRHGSQDTMGNFVAPSIGTIIHRFTTANDERAQDASAGTGVFFEMRQTPATFGLGLIEQIPEATIRLREDPSDGDGDGISGRAHTLSDGRLGRFGWKAQVPSLQEFARDALSAELGITLPTEAGQTFGATSDTDGASDPEVPLNVLQDLVFFMENLGPPPRNSTDPAAEQAGATLFTQVGCAHCHLPSMDTAGGTPVPLYSDLLLHDVAPTNALGIPDGDATEREFRTPPLWGLSRTAPYMHDGRSDTLEEAILRHDAEAAGSRTAYQALTQAEQDQLLAFLRSL